MRVFVLHQAAGDESTVDERDVLCQRDAVLEAVERLGHEATSLACTLALDSLREALQRDKPDVVFNLVESLGGSDQLMALAPMLLEAIGVPYTGVAAEAIVLSSSKTVSKRRLARSGLPTLPWVEYEQSQSLSNEQARSIRWPSRWIRKPVYEHASFGMSDSAVIDCRSFEDVLEQTLCWQQTLGRACFAEPFIDGREFNVSLLTAPHGPEVLPIAEIDFVDFPAGKPRIVGYDAKWHPEAAEYSNTPRRFDFSSVDQPLLTRLSELASRCWREFRMSGYCRVDLRVDDAGQPWILEINANPCLAPTAGFVAAIQQAGYTFDDAVHRILDDAITRWTQLTVPSLRRPVGSRASAGE